MTFSLPFKGFFLFFAVARRSPKSIFSLGGEWKIIEITPRRALTSSFFVRFLIYFHDRKIVIFHIQRESQKVDDVNLLLCLCAERNEKSINFFWREQFARLFCH
jgi:hypothetical protein